jgi:hypothetical protein
LTGSSFEHNGVKWLHATKVKHAGSADAVAVEGRFMLHDQGGQILFPVDE